MVMIMKNKYNYVLSNIPNNVEGKYFMFLFNKYLNKDVYKTKKRGNGKRASIAKKEKKHPRTYDQDLPISKAERFRLYIDKKDAEERVAFSTYIGDLK